MKQKIILPFVAMLDIALLSLSITLLAIMISAGSALFISLSMEPVFIPMLLDAAMTSLCLGVGVYCIHATYHHLMQNKYVLSAIYSITPIFFWASFQIVMQYIV